MTPAVEAPAGEAADEPAGAGVRVGVAGRHRPQQERSRATVDAILDGAARVVDVEGPEALTTTAVAREAGIAVGSLYRYFENVEAIADALVLRHHTAFIKLLAETMEVRRYPTRTAAADAVLDAFIEYYRREPGFRHLWFSPVFPNRHQLLDRPTEHLLVATMAEGLAAQGLVDPDDPELQRDVLVIWTLADALLHLAFRLDADGDKVVLAHLRRHLELELAGK